MATCSSSSSSTGWMGGVVGGSAMAAGNVRGSGYSVFLSSMSDPWRVYGVVGRPRQAPLHFGESFLVG